MDIHHSIIELSLLRIVKFAHGVRQFIAAFNDGIYSVPSKCREINFAKQGGNKFPLSKERCHAHKSKIYSTIRLDYLYFDNRHSNVRLFKSRGLRPHNLF